MTLEMPGLSVEDDFRHSIAHALCEALAKCRSDRAELTMGADIYVVPKRGDKYLLGTLAIDERPPLQ